MRGFFFGLTVVLVIIGLFLPVLWVVAIITAVLAIASAPSGVRADGKPRSGGLLGGVWDAAAVSMTTRDCPHCRTKIDKRATVCPQCSRNVPVEQTIEHEPVSQMEHYMRWCPCGEKAIHKRAPVCPHCMKFVNVE